MTSHFRNIDGRGNSPWFVLLASCMAAFLVTLDVTIINIALPSIQRDLKVTLVQGSWVINAYTLAFASLVILGGKLGDIFGRKRLLLIGFAVFGLGSLTGGFAQDIHVVHLARVIQGLGGAMMLPGSLSVLTTAFHNRNLSLAIGLWGGIAALGLIVGPIVGGAFTSFFNWRAIFFFNLPLVIGAFLLAWILARESKDSTIDSRIDFYGVTLSAGSVFLLILAIIEGNTHGWTSVRILGFFSGAGFLIILFILAELMSPSPLIDPNFFKNRAFTVGVLVRFAAGFGYVPVVLMSTIYLQTFMKKSPIEAGLMFLPAGIIIVIATPFWGRIINFVGPRWPMIIGMLFTGFAALLWLRFDGTSGYGDLMISLALGSLGGTAAFVTTTSVTINALGIDKVGVASGIVSMVQNVSAGIGVAAVSAIFLSSLKVGLSDDSPLGLFQQIQAFGPAAGDAAQAQIFTGALSDAAIVVAVVMFIGAAIACLLPREHSLSPKSPG